MATIAIDHVQIAIPVGGEEEGRRFFGELLGLTELPKPAELAARGGCWFAVGQQQLHLGAEVDFRAARKAHVGLATDTLDEVRERLNRAGYDTEDGGPVERRRRFFTHDPFGNRIELMDAKARA